MSCPIETKQKEALASAPGNIYIFFFWLSLFYLWQHIIQFLACPMSNVTQQSMISREIYNPNVCSFLLFFVSVTSTAIIAIVTFLNT